MTCGPQTFAGAALLAASVALAVGATSTERQPLETAAFLRNILNYDTNDLRQMAAGHAAVRALDTIDGREVAIAGAIRVPIAPDRYIAQLRDIVEFKRHEAVIQIGTLSAAPHASDLAGLTLDRDHLNDLRRCRPAACDVQLSRAGIARVQAIPWSAPGADERANALVRELLAGMTADYRRVGDAALMTYENDQHPIVVADEFRAMVTAPPALLQRFGVLDRHLRGFPATKVDGVEDVIYWSKEDVGPKVIISVTHMAIHRVDEGPVLYAAASKQLYGSHYFDSSLGLTLLLADDTPSSSVLVYVNRSRVDALSGWLGGLKRAVVRSRARSAMSDTLVRIRTRLPARISQP